MVGTLILYVKNLYIVGVTYHILYFVFQRDVLF